MDQRLLQSEKHLLSGYLLSCDSHHVRSQHLNVVRSALSGIPSLAWIPEPESRGQEASDAGDEVPEFIATYHYVKAGLCLTDAADSRHQLVVQLRQRTGELLHNAVQTLKSNAREDSIDCVRMTIATIRVLELDYPCDHSHHAAVKKSHEFALQISRTTRNQKLFPR